MITRIGLCLATLVLCGLSWAQAQDVQVSRSNKTIQVTASTTLRVEPEIAQLRFGFKNYAATQQAAIDQNVQAANMITKALLDSGVPKEAIETETIRIDRTRDTEYGTSRSNNPEFVAVQGGRWTCQSQKPKTGLSWSSALVQTWCRMWSGS
jgi:uncharacterized protein YggE